MRSIIGFLSAALCASTLFLGCGDDDGGTDGGRTDSGRVDSGGADSGGEDSGGVDAGGDDSGGVDSGGVDSGGDDAASDSGFDDGGSECEPACGAGRTCCDGACVNTENDGRHCGGCDSPCPGPARYCTGGTCEDVPCEGACVGIENCCGSMCCGIGQICCDPQGPIEMGPRCFDPDPDTGTCPQGCAPLCMCNAPGTPIATPRGLVAIADLSVGDLVYSVDQGAVVIVPIAEVRSVEVAADHHVVRLVLDDGTEVEISPSHPLADGRTIGDLSAGDAIEGVGVSSATLIPYEGERTHDILPASDSGTYFVGDALIGSTIVR